MLFLEKFKIQYKREISEHIILYVENKIKLLTAINKQLFSLQ